MEYIAIFKNNPTSGGTDGVEVSSGGLGTSPVEATLNMGTNNVQVCAVRCASGCSSASVTLTSLEAWLTLSEDNVTYDDSITLTNVGDTNKTFYVKITAGSSTGVSTGSIELEATVVNNA